MEEPSAATNGHSECEIKTEAAAAPPTEVDPEVKQIVFEWITETLHKAWRSKEDSDKKKVIKQLMLKWHPDKNQDDPALALAATQYIQSEIERLDNGLPARTRSSYRSTFSATPTFRSTRTAYDDDDFVQQKYESMYKSFSENIRKKREEFQRQFDERDRAAKAEQQQRSREREEQWRRFEDQRKEREREAKQERDRQQQKAKERRERFDREQREREEILRAERKKRFGGQNDTENGHNSTNGDARPRESLHKNKGKSQTNEKAAPISDEEKITGMILQAGHDLKAAENDMNLDVPAHEWACFKAHQVGWSGSISCVDGSPGRMVRISIMG